MSNTIKLKNSAVAAKAPLTSDLVYGEVALNYADGKIYYKRSDNTIQSISSSGGGVGSTLTGTVASWAVVNTFTGVLNPQEIFFKPDGLKMFLLTATQLHQYTLSTAWDITTAGSLTTLTTAWDVSNLGLFISPDGTKLITSGNNAVVNAGLSIVAGEDRAYYLTLSTPWDITTATLVSSLRFSLGGANPLATGGLPDLLQSPQAVHFNSTGTTMYIPDSSIDYVNQFSLSTAYNVSTAQWVKRFSVAAVESGCTGLRFNAAGTRMYIIGSTNDIIAEYRLSTAWDIATAVYYDEIYVGFSDATPNGLCIDETSGNAYMVGSSSDLVTRFTTASDGILLAPVLATGRIDLAGETRVKNASLIVDNNLVVTGNMNVGGIAATGSSTFYNTFTLAGGTNTISLGESQTTGNLRVGGTTGTGIITFGQSTAAQVLSIANGATLTGVTKTVNIGASGVSGSTTNINIGSGVAGATSTVAVTGTVTVAGQIESTVTGFKFPDGTVQASAASGSSIDRKSYIATAGQTVFTVSYTAPYLEVFVNGVRLSSADYTATNGTSVTLSAASLVGDEVELMGFGASMALNGSVSTGKAIAMAMIFGG